MMRIRSGRILKAAAALAVTVLAVSSCRFFEPYNEYNPDANVPVDFIAGAHFLTFGVSTGDSSENSITLNPDGTVTLRAVNDIYNAGKIAGSEDGITFYFREVPATKNFKLSATVRVDFFGARDTKGAVASNGQEGFGLMARDYVPQYPGFTIPEVAESVASGGEYQARPIDPATGKAYGTIPGGSSNMVMVGAVKRGARAAIRRGVSGSPECVTNPDTIASAGKSIFEYLPKELSDYSMYPTLDARPEFPTEGSVYKYSLVKTNSEFVATIIPPANKGTIQEYRFPYPDILTEINEDVYYVGFFAARSAVITVSDITYFESNSADDAPPIKPVEEIIVPELKILSPKTDSDDDYRLYCSSNVRGTISVIQDGTPVPGVEFFEGRWYSSLTDPAEAAVLKDVCMFEIPVLPLKPGENAFQIVFYPEESPTLSSTDPIRKTFTVNRKSFFDVGTPIYVSPTGRSINAGTASNPLDLDTAIAYVLPGQKIIMLGGTYIVKSVVIPRYNTGKRGAYKQLVAETRGKVFIDFDNNIDATGFELKGDFWRIDGIHVRNTPDKVKGLVVSGHNNIVEWVETYNNGDTGLQISGSSTESRTWWPTNNIVRYCASYNNLDAAQSDADGFAAKLTVGVGNRFEWCVAHHNCDDGWDLFTKKETGTIPPVVIENCIAYRNGTLLDGTKTLSGRNGFKLGGEGLGSMHVVRNSFAFQNGAHGFTSNSNPDIQLENCTSFDNGIPEWNLSTTADSRNFTIYNGSGKINDIAMKCEIKGLLSLYSDGTGRSEDKIVLRDNSSGYAWIGQGTGSSTGTATRNYGGTVLVDATHPIQDLVVSTTPPLDENQFIARDSQGRFLLDGFLELKPGTTTDNPGADFSY